VFGTGANPVWVRNSPSEGPQIPVNRGPNRRPVPILIIVDVQPCSRWMPGASTRRSLQAGIICAAESISDAFVDGVGLAVDAVGVDLEQDGDAVPGAAGPAARGRLDRIAVTRPGTRAPVRCPPRQAPPWICPAHPFR